VTIHDVVVPQCTALPRRHGAIERFTICTTPYPWYCWRTADCRSSSLLMSWRTSPAKRSNRDPSCRPPARRLIDGGRWNV